MILRQPAHGDGDQFLMMGKDFPFRPFHLLHMDHRCQPLAGVKNVDGVLLKFCPGLTGPHSAAHQIV